MQTAALSFGRQSVEGVCGQRRRLVGGEGTWGCVRAGARTGLFCLAVGSSHARFAALWSITHGSGCDGWEEGA